MKDLDRLIARWREFGGWRLVWQYAKMGVLWIGVKEIIRCAVTGRSFKTVYPVVTERIAPLLLPPAGGVVHSVAEKENPPTGEIKGGLWFCWLQGIENAPVLVKKCQESVRENISEGVIVLDERNYTEYVTLPGYIVEKYRKGVIPSALFSDMLRLELLVRYGGTWIDATVLASPQIKKEGSKCQKAWQRIMESELFIYRYFNKEGRVVGMSNWFIHAKAGNPLLRDVREMLFAYWKDYNCVVEYYMFHLFFREAAKRYPEMIRQMPKGNSYHALWLGAHADKQIDEETWEKLMENVPFHKLNWRKKLPDYLTEKEKICNFAVEVNE